MSDSKGTALEALVAEMLGDIGRLHASVRSLRGELAELHSIQQNNIDNYASVAVGEAISQASADAFDQLSNAAIDALRRVAESKNITPRLRWFFAIKVTAVFSFALVAFVAGAAARPTLVHLLF